MLSEAVLLSCQIPMLPAAPVVLPVSPAAIELRKYSLPFRWSEYSP